MAPTATKNKRKETPTEFAIRAEQFISEDGGVTASYDDDWNLRIGYDGDNWLEITPKDAQELAGFIEGSRKAYLTTRGEQIKSAMEEYLGYGFPIHAAKRLADAEMAGAVKLEAGINS